MATPKFLPFAMANMPGSTTASMSNQTFSIDATSDFAAWGMFLDDDMLITHVGFNIVSGTLTATFQVSIQGATGNGQTGFHPDGSIKNDGGGDASTTVTLSTGWNWVALDNDYQGSRGEALSIVLEYDSGTLGAGPNVLLGYNCRDNIGIPCGHSSTDSGVSWSNDPQNLTICSFRSATERNWLPVEDFTLANPSMAVDDFIAQEINIPTALCSTYKIRGVMCGRFASSNGTRELELWNTSDTILQTTVVDRAMRVAPTVANDKWGMYIFDDTTLDELDAGTTYYIGIKGAGSLLEGWQFPSQADMVSQPMESTSLGIRVYDDSAGTWDTTTWQDYRWHMALLLDEITPPVAGPGAIEYGKRATRGVARGVGRGVA